MKDKDRQIAGLEQKFKASKKRAYMQQLICNFEESGTSNWHFDPDDIRFALAKFVIPYICDTDT